jgi:molybdopterin/thiamine biosynthesis adenylyltransferase
VSPPPAALASLRDGCVGTMVATEVVKALLGIGTGLTGRVLAYDPATATVDATAADSRPGCACAQGS